MKNPLRNRHASPALWLTLAVGPCSADEVHAPLEDASTAPPAVAAAARAPSPDPASRQEFSVVAGDHSLAPIAPPPPDSLMLTPEPSWRLEHPRAPAEEPNPFAQLRFRDQEPLINRLRRLQALPFVTLWDSRAATLYVGVNRDGETGLHLRQKREDRGTRARNPLVQLQRDELAPGESRPTGPRR